MKTNQFLFAALTAAFLSVASFSAAQVTIGGGDQPAAGAVLDLNSTTKGGLLLSNVSIVDLGQIPENAPNVFPGISGATTEQKQALAGMIVWNTGKTDGTISRNGDIIITGEKIKIAPDGEAGLGVFFVTAGGAETQDSNPLVQNDPKKIVCRVPNLPEGPFTLKIVTCFTSGNILLKEPAPLSMNCRLIRNRPLWFPSKNI